ncbi:uncharacterized protein LOC111636053 isoform X2 [Centruroides sculpturatus]|uniref:uncharacterized protein LOC111636053 isoform X2 n=1 Tax=Centruroides sculpturatus TaxID=218467 RepID=UPI000C6CFF41|nr:uncharacterized protein LOC111636053 isoform X2 [Centruroides sculpturatus]
MEEMEENDLCSSLNSFNFKDSCEDFCMEDVEKDNIVEDETRDSFVSNDEYLLDDLHVESTRRSLNKTPSVTTIKRKIKPVKNNINQYDDKVFEEEKYESKQWNDDGALRRAFNEYLQKRSASKQLSKISVVNTSHWKFPAKQKPTRKTSTLLSTADKSSHTSRAYSSTQARDSSSAPHSLRRRKEKKLDEYLQRIYQENLYHLFEKHFDSKNEKRAFEIAKRFSEWTGDMKGERKPNEDDSEKYKPIIDPSVILHNFQADEILAHPEQNIVINIKELFPVPDELRHLASSEQLKQLNVNDIFKEKESKSKAQKKRMAWYLNPNTWFQPENTEYLRERRKGTSVEGRKMGKLLFNFLLLTVAIYPTLAVPSTLTQFIRSRNETAKLFFKLLSEPQILDREWRKFYKFEGIPIPEGDKPLLEFSWSNCALSAPCHVKSLSVSPDPIDVPGSVTVSFDVVVATNLTSPIQVDIKMKKKVYFVWVEVPCMDNIGSCSYSDFCDLVPTTCPSFVKKAGLPCKCPVIEGEYKLDPTTVEIPNIPLPSFLEDGDYKATVNGFHNGKQLFCYNVAFSLHKN